MDHGQLDTLARFVAAKRSRRTVGAALFGAMLLGRGPAALGAASSETGRGSGQDHPSACYRHKGCRAGARKRDNDRCDFTDSTKFFQRDLRGAKLRGANLTGAQLAEADLHGADLSGACLVGANLHGANIDDTTKLDSAIFCRTLMPDGSSSDRDCGKGTSCCPTPAPVCKACRGGNCISSAGQICSIFGTPCCPGLSCTASAIPVVTTCEAPCSDDETCRKLFGPQSFCTTGFGNCPFFAGSRCCDPGG